VTAAALAGAAGHRGKAGSPGPESG
jgi:hypothetical protein